MPEMIAMLQDLIQHNGYANASLLKAIRQHEEASHDHELRKLLHHIILANRFWLWLILGRPFNEETESRMPESMEEIVTLYRETHVREMEWLAQIQESDLSRILETSYLPNFSCSVAQAMTQVCLHSHGHRAQFATRLRQLGVTPPTLDFILWLKDRPASNWEQESPLSGAKIDRKITSD
jgi:uncharacterized damage-inducible protein DinB